MFSKQKNGDWNKNYSNISTCWISIKIEQKMEIAFWFESQCGFFSQCNFSLMVFLLLKQILYKLAWDCWRNTTK